MATSKNNIDIPKSLLEFKRKKGKTYADFGKPVDEDWKTCKGYVRCSTVVQMNHFSLEAQEEMIREKAVILGLPLIKIYRDEAVSGAREDRDGLQEMISNLGRGDILIIVSISCLSRNIPHFYKLIDKIHRKGVRLISIGDRVDTSNPGFETGMHLSALYSYMERNMTNVESKNETIKRPEMNSSMKDKPLPLLRAILLKRKTEFMLTEEDIAPMTKEDILEVLS